MVKKYPSQLPKVVSSEFRCLFWFSPQPNNIQFTIIYDQEKQQIFICAKLAPNLYYYKHFAGQI